MRPRSSLIMTTIAAGLTLALLASAQERLVDPLADQRSNDQQVAHEFSFTRAYYNSYRFPSWAVDFPKADRQFVIGLRKLTRIDASPDENPIRLDDPELRRFPILYAVEVGYMALTEAERQGLRSYLLAGGLMIIDDFWGSREWNNFEAEMQGVFPEFQIVDIPLGHPLLHVFYDLTEIIQVPNVHQGRWGDVTYEKDGYYPALKGIFNDQGRLMMAIHWNTDLGDAWEWAEDPHYPLDYSNFAYKLGVNLIVYGMSH